MPSTPFTIKNRPDFSAEQARILGLLGEAPELFGGFDNDYLRNTNNLYQDYAAKMLGLENARAGNEVDFARNWQESLDTEKSDRERLASQLAFRGLLGSSAMNDKLTELGTNYTKQRSGLQTAYDRAIAELTGQASGAQSAYDVGLATEGEGLTKSGRKYIDDQAAAKIAQNNQITAGQSTAGQSDISGQIANAMAGLYQQQNTWTPDAIANYISSRYGSAAPAAPAAPQAPTNPYKTAADPYLANPFGVSPGVNTFTSQSGVANNTRPNVAITGKPGTYWMPPKTSTKR